MAGRGARGGGRRKLRAGGRERGKGAARQRWERAGRCRLQESRAGKAPGAGRLGGSGPDGPAPDRGERRRLPGAYPEAMGQAAEGAPAPGTPPRRPGRDAAPGLPPARPGGCRAPQAPAVISSQNRGAAAKQPRPDTAAGFSRGSKMLAHAPAKWCFPQAFLSLTSELLLSHLFIQERQRAALENAGMRLGIVLVLESHIPKQKQWESSKFSKCDYILVAARARQLHQQTKLFRGSSR